MNGDLLDSLTILQCYYLSCKERGGIIKDDLRDLIIYPRSCSISIVNVLVRQDGAWKDILSQGHA